MRWTSMLEQLHIKNVALIEEAEVDFGNGLNILSGETGAGKSMLIDSINFAMGERAGRDFIRKGAEQAVVEVLFSVRNPEMESILTEQGIRWEEDGTILIKRVFYSGGKVQNKVNGSTVTVGMLKQLSDTLIDIHGQHEHQSLLNPSKHIRLLDPFCGEELEQNRKKLESIYKKYKELQKQIEKLSGNERERAHKLDLLQFQTEEITQAGLKENEEEQLYDQKKRLSNGEKIRKLSTHSLQKLHTGSDAISEAAASLEDLSELDGQAASIFTTVETAYAQLDDALRELNRYADSIDSNPDEINQLEDRLTIIYNLKKKYGNSIQEILEYNEEIQKEIAFISGSEEILLKLTKEMESIKKELAFYCEEMTKIRKKKAEELQNKIELQLHELEMKNASFEIRIDRKNETTQDGWDKVEFLISANLGEELKPLAKIASGGEMSRVMLALKTVLAGADIIDTFIFDEIDTGVSGRTAQKVAEKLAFIGTKHQIICITHLPQIASMADHHFLIEKQAEEGKTTTNVYTLDQKSSVDEIARLIGGAKITDSTKNAAEEMKNLAGEWKKAERKKYGVKN